MDRTFIRVSRRKTTAWIAGLLSWSILIAGCAQPRYVSSPSAAKNTVETVAFTSMKDRVDIVDVATSEFVTNNFSITLANDRIGLVQTDYISITSLQEALADTMDFVADLDNLLMKVALNAEQRDESVFIQMKGTFQRVKGTPRSVDNLIGLYWLEQIAQKIATDLDATYVHQLDEDMYASFLEEMATKEVNKNNTGVRGAIKAGGIIVAVLFALTLLAGTFGPTTSTPTTAQ